MGRRSRHVDWSTRLCVMVVFWLVASASVPGEGGVGQFTLRKTGAVAFNGGSCSGVAPAIVARRLIVARLDSLPAPPIALDVHRVSLSPSGELRPVVSGGFIAIFVDAGAVTAEIVGAAMLTVAAVPVGGTMLTAAAVPVSGTVSLGYSDQLVVSLDASLRLTNDGSAPAVLVIARVVPAARSWPFATAGGNGAVEWEVLAAGEFANVPPPPVYLLGTRIVYASGAGDLVSTENGGPLAIAVEEGTVGYLLTAGNSTLVPPGQSTGRALEPGEEVLLPTGAYVVEEWEAVSSLRNAGVDRAWVLATTLVQANSSENDRATILSTVCKSDEPVM